ncbi:MAG TPA: ABC transporter permease [Lachnospiraceae bacterium]|nr:ABC transporter permease [Lachnospiraceae bacterium]
MTAAINTIQLSALETRKLKRTGYVPAFLGGGVLAGLVPVLNMAVRSEIYVTQSGSPFQILMDANWQLMAQLNILLLVCGACILYHTEYAENGIQRAETLPMKASGLFPGKLCILFCSCLLPLCLETLSLLFCCVRYFPREPELGSILLKGIGFELALLLPTAAAMLFLSSLCRNLWMCLGTGVILVFFSSMLRFGDFLMAVIPFAAPYRMLHQFSSAEAWLLLSAAAAEVVLFYAAEMIYTKLRRSIQ